MARKTLPVPHRIAGARAVAPPRAGAAQASARLVAETPGVEFQSGTVKQEVQVVHAAGYLSRLHTARAHRRVAVEADHSHPRAVRSVDAHLQGSLAGGLCLEALGLAAEVHAAHPDGRGAVGQARGHHVARQVGRLEADAHRGGRGFGLLPAERVERLYLWHALPRGLCHVNLYGMFVHLDAVDADAAVAGVYAFVALQF